VSEPCSTLSISHDSRFRLFLSHLPVSYPGSIQFGGFLHTRRVVCALKSPSERFPHGFLLSSHRRPACIASAGRPNLSSHFLHLPCPLLDLLDVPPRVYDVACIFFICFDPFVRCIIPTEAIRFATSRYRYPTRYSRQPTLHRLYIHPLYPLGSSPALDATTYHPFFLVSP
jgi:hypothetical protein